MGPTGTDSAAVMLAGGALFTIGAVGSFILAVLMLRRNGDRDKTGFGVAMMLFFSLATLGVTVIYRAYTMSWLFPATSPAVHDTNLVLYPATFIAFVGTILCFLPAFAEYRRQLAEWRQRSQPWKYPIVN